MCWSSDSFTPLGVSLPDFVCYNKVMAPKLNDDVEKAVHDKHGFTQAAGRQGSYIVMSVDAFREMMGVGTGDELAASLKAIDEGLADVKAGKTRPYMDVIADLG